MNLFLQDLSKKKASTLLWTQLLAVTVNKSHVITLPDFLHVAKSLNECFFWFVSLGLYVNLNSLFILTLVTQTGLSWIVISPLITDY